MTCDECGIEIFDDGLPSINGGIVCEVCYEQEIDDEEVTHE